MKKVLIVSPVSLTNENNCGISKIVFNLIYDNENIDFSIICPRSKNNSELEIYIKKKYFNFEIKLVNYLKKFLQNNPFTKFELYSVKDYILSKSKSYDIIHVFSYKFISIINNLKPSIRTKIIVSLIDSEPRYYENLSQNEENIFLKYLYKYLSLNSIKLEKKLIKYNIPLHFVSSIDAEFFRKKHYNFNLFNVYIVKNGVNKKIFFPIKNKNINNKKIVFYGNMNYKPNLKALNFIVNISNLVNEFDFHIIGKLHSNSDVFREKNIIYRGYVKDLNYEINNANIAIFPIFIGTGIKNKVLEAFATGVKVIATKIATEDIPIPTNCKIINSHDPQIWANEIIKSSAQKNNYIATVPYTWNKFRNDFTKIYNKI